MQSSTTVTASHPSLYMYTQLEARTLNELTVEQLLSSLCEAGAHRVEARGKENAKQLLTQVGQAKGELQQRLALANGASVPS